MERFISKGCGRSCRLLYRHVQAAMWRMVRAGNFDSNAAYGSRQYKPKSEFDSEKSRQSCVPVGAYGDERPGTVFYSRSHTSVCSEHEYRHQWNACARLFKRGKCQAGICCAGEWSVLVAKGMNFEIHWSLGAMLTAA